MRRLRRDDMSRLSGLRRIEIGGGPHPLYAGYEQYDAQDWESRTGLRYTIGDARSLPYEDASCEIVYSSNLLEHFPEEETTAILTEWVRVLAPGGTLELVVPDSMGVLRDFFRGINGWTECAERLRGSMDYDGNEHHRAFTLSDFPVVLGKIPGLVLQRIESSHQGGGIHSWSIKER